MLGVLLASAVAWVVAGLYRRRMLALMRGGASPSEASPSPVEPTGLPQAPVPRSPMRLDGQANRRAQWRYLLAMTGLSLLMGVTQSWLNLILVYPENGITLSRVLLLGAVYAWPMVMAWGLLRRWSWARVVLAVGAYMVLMAVLTMVRSTAAQSLAQVADWLGSVVIIPMAVTLLIGASGRIRAVAPYLLPTFLVLSIASVLVLLVLAQGAAHPPAWIIHLVGTLGVWPTLLLLALAPWALLAWPVYRMGRALAQAYRDKRFSDLSYLFAAYWFVVLFASALPAYQGSGMAGLAQMLAWLWIPVGGSLSRPWLAPKSQPPTLLVLRVFQQDAQIAKLFDRVVERWRLSGNTVLIAGADLIGHTLDPDDLFAFLNGDLASRFIANVDQVPQRLRGFDWQPDPDGRFRVNECYCFDTTWQAALAALVQGADVVLMDLRGFQARNLGCRHELGVLGGAAICSRWCCWSTRAPTAPWCGRHGAGACGPICVDRGRTTAPRKAGEITAALFGQVPPGRARSGEVIEAVRPPGTGLSSRVDQAQIAGPRDHAHVVHARGAGKRGLVHRCRAEAGAVNSSS